MPGELIELAAEQQLRFDSSTSPRDRRHLGHFGTARPIAEFMAGMFSEIPRGEVRILDPGAGVGTLSAAVCQRILGLKSPRHVVLELWENHAKPIPFLEKTMTNCQKVLREAGHKMEFVIRVEDFILGNGPRKSLFDSAAVERFHLAILNPPYSKLRQESPHARAMPHVVHGQPNIYVLFMAVAADCLVPRGEFAAITPRSYFNGPYFKRFRKWFFDRMTARQIHVFESRTEAFRNDSVLQENVILLAQKGGEPSEVLVTNSVGRDLDELEEQCAPYDKIIDNSHGDHIVRVLTNRFEHDVLEAMDRLPKRFRELGYKISTGPVVAFRSTEFLRAVRSSDTAPLLWMHNVRPFVTHFPRKKGKAAHIVVSEESRRLLVKAKIYVLLKRFTAKEEKRRLVAGIVKPDDSYSQWVGLENHLNYVYRHGSELKRNEALGLAAFFNSVFVDRYFRAISGNTQVNAAEIRTMPVPDEATLARIGDEIDKLTTTESILVERIVGTALHLPRHLMTQLDEMAK